MTCITIIIPTYNRFVFLQRALHCARHQTYPNVQIIVSDDASAEDIEDQTNYINALNDPRIVYLTSDENQGFVKNLNKALKRATGDYISILFDDDIFHEDYAQEAIRVFEKHRDIAFVQMGAFNQFEIEKTIYHPPVCGKMTKYSYLNYIAYTKQNDNISWSVSPCNYVFKNSKILFREDVPGWHERQMKRGSGYDVLFILDHLKEYDFCYHLPNHLCTFNSHPTSASVLNPTEVLPDTKKGIDVYFEENPLDIFLEIDNYILSNITFSITDDIIELIDLFFKIIVTHNISLYEIKPIFFSHGFYNPSLDYIKAHVYVNPHLDYVELKQKYMSASKTHPDSSLHFLTWHMNTKSTSTSEYNVYLANFFKVPVQPITTSLIQLEMQYVANDKYVKANEVNFNMLVKVYWDDFVDRNLKRITWTRFSNNIKHVSMYKRPEATTKHINHTWEKTILRYLHKNSTTFKTEEEIYNSLDFKLVHRIPRSWMLMDFDAFKRTFDKAWELIPIPLLYKDVKQLYATPEHEWLEYIKHINYNVPMYKGILDIYDYNEIFGEDLTIALQISGHLRFHKKLAASISKLKMITQLDTYLFIWDDGMGFKKTTYQSQDVTEEITSALESFKPVAHTIENNKEYMNTNLFFHGITFVECTGCSYPQLKSQYYSVYKCNELRKRAKKNYDVIIKLRFDAELEEPISPKSLFEIFFCTHVKDFIFVSFEKDHGHTGGFTGCDLCNVGYYNFRHPTKHFGEHSNDICDFMAIARQDNMNYYANIYNIFEDLYLKYNANSYQKVQALSPIMTSHGDNTFLPEQYRQLYDRIIAKPEMSQQYRIYMDVPLYPEAMFRIYLKQFVVVSNRHFRFKFHYLT